MPTILIVDDERNIRSTLARGLKLEGFETLEAADGAEALERLEASDVDLVIVDLQMPGMDGMAFLEKLAERRARVPALVLTAHATIERAVRAIRLGAIDFIEKPPSVDRILVAAGNALKLRSLEEENRRLSDELGLTGRMLGASPAMLALAQSIARVAPTEAGVLITGENGTGKEMVARAIHEASARRGRALVTVNCAAIPATLFESELFGHVRGAFTGATENRRGKFQQADGGTLFLDEIGEVPSSLQPKLLRALETGEVERIGGRGAEKVDVRVLAATNRDIAAEVAAGRFREDLYYRLLVVPVRVPPLTERVGDIPVLAGHFLERACRRNRVRPKRLLADALEHLKRRAWPGNVRELRNFMERVSILLPAADIGAADLAALERTAPGVPRPGAGAALSGPVDLQAEMLRHERAIVIAALERTRWRMARAARELGLERSHLYKKLKALGIERPSGD